VNWQANSLGGWPYVLGDATCQYCGKKTSMITYVHPEGHYQKTQCGACGKMEAMELD